MAILRNITCLLWVLILSSNSFGYIRQATNVVGDTSPASLVRTDNAAIQFLLNANVVPGLQSSASGKSVTVISPGSDPQAAVRASLATWNAVTTANVKFLPLKSTTLGIDPNDNTMVIALGASGNDLSLLGPALAVTLDFYTPVSQVIGGVSLPKGAILDSDIIVSPAYPFSTDGSTTNDLQAVITHELGHSLSANHTGLLGASMFQFNSGQRLLSTDDLAFVNAAYPLPGGGAALGTISGTVTAPGGAPVPFALLTAFDTSAGVSVGGVTSPDGNYSIQVPPGNYQLYAEPLNGAVAINIYLTSDQASLAAATKFQTTFFNGSFNVAANGTASANITVTSGASSLKAPYVGVSAVNGNPGLLYVGAPVAIPSGQSVDLNFFGAGFDSTLKDANFAIYGQGISLVPGSVRVDPNITFNGFKDLRLTLKVDARTTASLASFVVTSGSNVLSFSGALVIVPPTPTFISKGVISAASGLGNGSGNGAVSPGELVAVYGTGLSPAGGPLFGGFNNNGYDTGFLPPNLAGVSVTFDGVPAPLFFVSQGQLNLQVPFEVAGKTSTQVVVNFFGSVSSAATVPVLASHPAFFTYPGPTTAYIGNQNPDSTGNYTNTVATPAARGDYITVYGTGVGVLPYQVQTGAGAPVPPTSVLNVAAGLYFSDGFTCSIGGINTPVLFAGWTPTSVALAQWNIQVPQTLTTTGAVPIGCSNSTGSTQPNLTVFVK